MWRSRSFHIFGATTTNARSALWTILDSCTVIAAWPGSHSAVPPSLSVGLCVSCPLQCGSSMVMNGSSSLCSGSSSLASYSYHCCVDWGGAEKEKDEVIHKRLDCYFIFSAVNNNVTFHLCEAADCRQRLQEQWFVLRKARHEGFCMEPVHSHTYISILTLIWDQKQMEGLNASKPRCDKTVWDRNLKKRRSCKYLDCFGLKIIRSKLLLYIFVRRPHATLHLRVDFPPESLTCFISVKLPPAALCAGSYIPQYGERLEH